MPTEALAGNGWDVSVKPDLRRTVSNSERTNVNYS
jgi:hypothetical protein